MVSFFLCAQLFVLFVFEMPVDSVYDFHQQISIGKRTTWNCVRCICLIDDNATLCVCVCYWVAIERSNMLSDKELYRSMTGILCIIIVYQPTKIFHLIILLLSKYNDFKSNSSTLCVTKKCMDSNYDCVLKECLISTWNNLINSYVFTNIICNLHISTLLFVFCYASKFSSVMCRVRINCIARFKLIYKMNALLQNKSK